MGPSWDRAIHAAVGKVNSCQHGGNGWAHPETFQKYSFLLWIVGFLGEVFKSKSFLERVIMALKNWAGIDSFPIHRLNQFKYSQVVLGPMQCFAHFFLRGLTSVFHYYPFALNIQILQFYI